MKTIAIIDDDVSIGDLLEELLHREGYATLRAYSGTEAVLLLADHRPDLVLLDLMLPGLSGEQVLPHLGGIPVIVVSARVEVDTKVSLLLGGAVDYVTKPFDTRELLARIAVRLRSAPLPPGDRLTVGPLVMDTAAHEVSVRGTPIRLTRTEYAILKLLMENPGRAIAKAVILERIALDTPDCTEDSLKQHISNLRLKLREACGRDMISAVWGIGYRLTSE